ncbi:MAG: tetratricopeptide repeat protein [Acidobacteriaceae bacterium]
MAVCLGSKDFGGFTCDSVKGASMLWVVFLVFLVAALLQPLAAQQSSENPQAAAHLTRAQRLLEEQKPDLAAHELEAVLASDPGNVAAQANLGVVFFFKNQCAQAIPHLTRALQAQPGIGKIRALLGVCQKREGQIKEAERNLEASLVSTQEAKVLDLIRSNLLDIYYAQGNLNLASRTVEDLLKSEPHNPDVLYMMYRVHQDIADRSRNALAAIAPDSGRMHQIMAEHFINEGDAADAIAQYERALAKDPKLPGVRFELAEAIMTESRSEASLDKAEAVLKEVLSGNPRDAGAEAKLGEIAASENHSKLAEERFSRALALNPDQLDALKGMATIATHRGENEKVAKFLQRAIQIDPMDDGLHYRLSVAYRNLNRMADSTRELNLFKKLHDLKNDADLVQQGSTSTQ